MDKVKKERQSVQGKVVSNKMNKTAVILVEAKKTHPRFKKITTISTKLKIHDEKNECQEGDEVQAMECRPLSREKRHELVKIVKRAK